MSSPLAQARYQAAVHAIAVSKSSDAIAKPVAEKNAMPPLRAGHVCLSEVMAQYTEWQDGSKKMTEKRNEATKELAGLRDEMIAVQKQAETTTGPERDAATRELVVLRRKFEDGESKMKFELDHESTKILVELYENIDAELKLLAEDRQLDAIYGHPSHPVRTKAEQKANPQLYIDVMLRASAIQPLYLRDSVDLTGELVKRLNASKKKSD